MGKGKLTLEAVNDRLRNARVGVTVAIRISVVFKLPVAVAAALMGHSPTVHWQTYNRWINQEQHQRVYDGVLEDEGRSKAPF